MSQDQASRANRISAYLGHLDVDDTLFPFQAPTRLALDTIEDPALVLELCLKVGRADADKVACAVIACAGCYLNLNGDCNRFWEYLHQHGWRGDQQRARVSSIRCIFHAMELAGSFVARTGGPGGVEALQEACQEICEAAEHHALAELADVADTDLHEDAARIGTDAAAARLVAAIQRAGRWADVEEALVCVAGEKPPFQDIDARARAEGGCS